MDGTPKDVRGWLLVFVILQLLSIAIFTLLPIIGSVRILEQSVALVGSGWRAFIYIVMGWESLKLLGVASLVWLMVRDRRWRTVRLNIAGLWLFGPVWRLAIDGVAWAVFAFDGYNIFWHYVGPVLYCSLWTAYLLTSERVANTYRPRPDEDGLADVFE
jgi:hypothetical protein